MRYTQSLIKTNKSAKQLDSVNATLLTKASFIDQTMAGVYSFLPLGWRVLNKIEDVVREEMDTIGAEMLMPALSPREIWQATGRDQSVDIVFEAQGGNDASRAVNNANYVLNFSHEEIIAHITSRLISSYRELPFAVYQVQTKFRNEPRPKSGIMRGREFRMKDLYSFHRDEADMQNYYEQVKQTYVKTYERLGLGKDTVIVAASGQPFTDANSHEFQTKCETGEDTTYYDSVNDVYYNEEIVPASVKKKNESFKSSEVGNIFPLGTKYAKAANWHYTDKQGSKQLVWMASYGIGTSRVMGVLVEKFHDDRGIIWPAQVAPFTVHLAALNLEEKTVKTHADAVYQQLTSAGIDVLYDDRRHASPGEKLADADLIGCPWRVVISKKTGEQLEVKQRTSPSPSQSSTEEFIKLVKSE